MNKFTKKVFVVLIVTWIVLVAFVVPTVLKRLGNLEEKQSRIHLIDNNREVHIYPDEKDNSKRVELVLQSNKVILMTIIEKVKDDEGNSMEWTWKRAIDITQRWGLRSVEVKQQEGVERE